MIANWVDCRHDYDLTKTFEVLVGKAPNQERFTVHHDLIVQRSEFFRAASSSCSTETDELTTLEDHEPEVFSVYLHCLYFGASALKDRLNAIVEDHAASDDGTRSEQSGVAAVNATAASDEGENSSEDSSDDDCSEDDDTEEGALVSSERKTAANILFVGNLDHNIDTIRLAWVFQRYGSLQDHCVVKKYRGSGRNLKSFGLVGFTDANNAKKALESFNGLSLTTAAFALNSLDLAPRWFRLSCRSRLVPAPTPRL